MQEGSWVVMNGVFPIVDQFMQSQSLYNTIYRIATEAPGDSGEPIDIRKSTEEEMSEIDEQETSDGDDIDNRGQLDTDLGIGDGGDDDNADDPVENLDNGDDPVDNLDNDEESDTDGMDENSDDQTDESSSDQELDLAKRIAIHENTINLLNTIENSKESFDQKYGHIISPDQIEDYDKIIKTFDDLISITKDILKKKFMKSDYQTLIKYNVTLNRVYDIIVRMVRNFIDDYYVASKEKLKNNSVH